jgi:type II secretory pathway component PulF
MTLAQPIPEVGWTLELYVAALLQNARAVSLPIVLGIVGLVVMWRILSYARWFQGLQQRVAIRLPFVGKIARRAALGRYTGALGLMLQGGVPVGEAAEEAALAAGHAAFTPRLLKAAAALRSGTPLSQAVVEAKLFEFETMGMIATGDESGAAPEMLQQVASYYRQENEAALRMIRRAAWAVIGAFWAIIAGAVIVVGLRVYYLDFIFRVPEWIGE